LQSLWEGVIGSEDARRMLDAELKDESEGVKGISSRVALANLDYIKTMNSNNRFTKMTDR
jgi:hypothetical protein